MRDTGGFVMMEAKWRMPEQATGRLSDDALSTLVERSDRKGLAHLVLHVLAIAGAGTIYAGAFDTAWMLPAAWLYGTALVFLFAPLHETVHHTAFRSRRINRAVSAVCGWILLLPPRYFRAFHLEHHRYTQDPERDPELAVPYLLRTWSRLSLAREWLPVLDIPRARTMLVHASGSVTEPYIGASERAAVVRGGTGLPCELHPRSQRPLGRLIGTTAMLWLWVVPVVLGQPMLRLYLLAEHTGCPMVPDMLRELAHRPHQRRRPLPRMEHALSRRAPRVRGDPLPRPAQAPMRHSSPYIREQSPGYASVHRELVRRMYRSAPVAGNR